MSKITKHNLYQRQTTLTEIGENGQRKLQNASIVVVGCGGLGCVAAVYLAASGIGNIHLVDFDTVDVSNLHRQVFYKTEDVGKSKSAILAKYIQSISPFVTVSFSNKAVSKSNVFDLIDDAEIVLDCTDSLPIKYLLNDACVIKDKILVYGSLYKFDGYVATFNLLDEKGVRSTNLRDAFPEIPTENIPNCSEMGTLNTIVGIIGLMQANEVLKIVTGIGSPLENQLLIYNSLDNSQFKMKLKPNFTKEKISKVFETENYEDLSCEINDDFQISQEDFKKVLKNRPNDLKIISVIENIHQELPFQVSEKVPMSIFQDWLSGEINISKEIIFVCNRGITSMTAVKLFKELFPAGIAKSLEGGVADYEY
ncbi:HesA/MoeB/ThiF family protein [Urechidicola croceus]|uniref:Molybdopterin biosynthesis protein MoeB n=1 Tax=Urechidicola croceus TaxID=1850246 RepID=A0A1D8P8I2_9FLAO|nr:HesA/MoeB/ThiF family protein [Urechidicola croceus]AOW20876.1 molybdopterin biosynthesis protein MoeB [Urechidicola croceus]